MGIIFQKLMSSASSSKQTYKKQEMFLKAHFLLSLGGWLVEVSNWKADFVLFQVNFKTKDKKKMQM